MRLRGNNAFLQLFDQDTWTYSYLLADEVTPDAVLIDPVIDQVDRDLNLLTDLNLDLRLSSRHISTQITSQAPACCAVRRVQRLADVSR
jgi:hypothetical protein